MSPIDGSKGPDQQQDLINHFVEDFCIGLSSSQQLTAGHLRWGDCPQAGPRNRHGGWWSEYHQTWTGMWQWSCDAEMDPENASFRNSRFWDIWLGVQGPEQFAHQGLLFAPPLHDCHLWVVLLYCVWGLVVLGVGGNFNDQKARMVDRPVFVFHVHFCSSGDKTRSTDLPP